jgi:hypothetical protein
MQNKIEAIKKLKMTIKVTELCSELPDGFREILAYCRNLGFAEYPDYDLIRNILKSTLKTNGLT